MTTEKNPLSEISKTDSAAIAQAELVKEPIVKEIGATTTFAHNKDYDATRVRVVPNMNDAAQDHEKWLYLSQGPRMGISVSLSTIQAIIEWAQSKNT